MEAAKSRDGRAIEEIGYYNPRTEPATIEIKEDRVHYWLSMGAQPTDTVRSLIDKCGADQSSQQSAKIG